MKTKTIHILVLMTALTFWFPGSVSADGNTPSQDELNLLELINQTRENPLGMATSLGMDSEQILKDLPELNKILIEGLPPLSFNTELYAVATAHTRDMLANCYYSHDSLDGRTYGDRIFKSGYEPFAIGESLGILAFENFVRPAEAVSVIFENMFRDELDPSRTEKRNILAPEIKDVGVGFFAGVFNLDGSSWNVYLTTCDFAAPVETNATELVLLRLINEARIDPTRAIEQAGVHEASGLDAFEDEVWVPDHGLPPLVWNEKLHEAARGHDQDMLEQLYFSSISPEGTTASERVESTGYKAQYVGETLGVFVSEHFVAPLEVVCTISEKMIRDELNLVSDVRMNIFNPELTEVGIDFEARVFDLADGECLHVYVVVADFARPVPSSPFGPSI